MLAVKQLNARGRLAMPEALEALEAFPGVTGSISFGPLEHLPKKEVTVVKITGTTLTLAALIQPQRVPISLR